MLKELLFHFLEFIEDFIFFHNVSFRIHLKRQSLCTLSAQTNPKTALTNSLIVYHFLTNLSISYTLTFDVYSKTIRNFNQLILISENQQDVFFSCKKVIFLIF